MSHDELVSQAVWTIIRAITKGEKLEGAVHSVLNLHINWLREKDRLAQGNSGVRDGWKLVPIEPNEEMRLSGARHLIEGPAGQSYADEAVRVFAAMLAAAPQPDDAEGE
jgi:hypothetical protein